MAYQFNGTNQYLSTASTPVSSAPFSVSLWMYRISGTGAQNVFKCQSSAGTHLHSIYILNDNVTIQSEAGAVAGNAYVSAGSTSTWAHICGVWSATNSRTIYRDATNSATNTTTVSPTDLTEYRVSSASGNFPFDGHIAEVGIWSAALTPAEINSLAAGFTPDQIRPQSLQFYAPLIRNLQDLRGGLTITNNNSATVATHPRVIQ